MAIDIVPKIKLDGEADFRKAMQGCTAELKLIQSEIKKSTAVYGDNAGSVKALTEKGEQLTQKLGVQQEKVEKLREMVRKAAEAYGENSDKTADWKAKLNDAEAQVAKTSHEIEANGKALKDATDEEEKHSSVTSKLKDAYNAAKQGVEEFKSAHPAAAKAVETLGKAAGTVAKGGLKVLETGVKTAGAAAAAAVGAIGAGAVALGKAVWNAAEDASKAGDEIDKASQRMNVSARSYQELGYAAQLSGVSMSTMETAAKNLAKSGSDLTLDQAIDQLQGISDESERAAKAQELFGTKAAYAMKTMLNDGPGAFKQMSAAAHEYGLIMSAEAVAASAAFQDTLGTMTGTMTAIKDNLAAEFMPGLNDVMSGITGLFTGDESAPEQIIQGVDSIMSSLGDVTDIIINIATNLVDTVIEIAPDVITGLVDGLTANLNKLVEAAVTLITTVADSLLSDENLNMILDAAFDLIETLMNGFLNPDSLSKIFNGAMQVVFKLGEFLVNNGPELINTALTLVTELVSGLCEGDGLDTLVHGAIDMVGAIATALLDNLDELLTAGVELAVALCDAIITYDWWSLAKKIFNSIKGAIKGLLFGETGEENDGSHAAGLSYVPYNDYQATLHQGERVLTAAENRAYTASERQSAARSDELRAIKGEITELRGLLRGGIGVAVNNPRDMARELSRRAAI